MEAYPDTTVKTEPAVKLATALSSRYALTFGQFAVCVVFALLFVVVAYLPLYHAVIWRHLESGRWILEHRALPAVDPALPLADGFRAVPTSWLSDVLFIGLFDIAGLSGLTSASTVIFLGILGLTFTLCFQRSQRIGLSLAAVLLVLALHWPRVAIVRPEWLGIVCFTLLLMRLSRWNEVLVVKRRWFAIAGLFALWANLDGSVVFGVLLLMGVAISRFLEVWTESRRLTQALGDRQFQVDAYRAELAAIISLCQPLGVNLWLDFLTGSRASFWWSLGGNQPLVLTTAAGMTVLFLWGLAAALLRLSQRPVSASDVVLMGLASALVVWNSLATIWSVPVFLYVLLPHLTDVADRWGWTRPAEAPHEFQEGDAPPPLAFAWTMLSVLAVWMAFVLTPVSNPVFGGKPRPVEQIVSKQAPLGVGRYFRQLEQSPSGLVWVPPEWGDWLSWTAPEGLYVSANSRGHLLTDRQQFDIAQVNRGEGNWTRTLDRYGVEWLVVDKQRQPRLFDAVLVDAAQWGVAYEDAQALVMRRKS